MSVCLSVGLLTKLFPIIILETIFHSTFIFHMPIGLGKDMTHIDFVFTRLSQGHMGQFCKKKMVSAHYLENFLSQSLHT